MRKKRVLLFSAHKLFGESIEQTLSHVENLELTGHWLVDDQVMTRLACASPDFVIITDEGLSPEQLSQLTAQILDGYPDLPVFRVTLGHNQMRVFRSHLVPARSEDLIDLIQQLPVKNTEGRSEKNEVQQ
jgi:DNA-binding NarL/FixJ family response regulator